MLKQKLDFIRSGGCVGEGKGLKRTKRKFGCNETFGLGAKKFHIKRFLLVVNLTKQHNFRAEYIGKQKHFMSVRSNFFIKPQRNCSFEFVDFSKRVFLYL